MNAHSVVSRSLRDCIPTQADYDRFRRMTFLHNGAPLFGVVDEARPEPTLVVIPTTQPQQALPPQAQVMTTPRANNIAQPFLRTPPIVVRNPEVRPEARSVTIMELLQMKSPGRVRWENLDIVVQIHRMGPISFRVCYEGKSFHITRFEILNKENPSTKRLRRDRVLAFVKLHRELRKQYLDVVMQNARPFVPGPEYLDSLVSGQYVIARANGNKMLFLVTGDKREKYLEYVTSIGAGLRIFPGTSVKVRRIPNGKPSGSTDEDKLLAYFQRLYA